MDLNSWLAFCAASLVLVLIPGPTVLLVLSYAMSKGRSVAVSSVAGVALGDFVAMTASLAGLGAVIMASATLFTVLKWIGGGYLIWMGINLYRSAGASGLGKLTESDISSNGVFRHAAIVTALNPKAIVFFLAFVPQFVTPAQPILPQFAILIASFVFIGSANALAYALLADRLRRRIERPGVTGAISRMGGVVLILFGVLTATSKRAV